MDWNFAVVEWQLFKGEVRANWARLTDSHLETIAGKRVRLADEIRDAYGLTRDQAEQQIRSFEARLRDPRPVSSR
jgi:uncharacterized protein YjbJ (UPF0337 family)